MAGQGGAPLSYFGLDAGGTKTEVVAIEEGGAPLLWRTYPTCYLPSVGEEGLRECLAQIWADLAPLNPRRGVLGLAGYGEVARWDEVYRRVVRETIPVPVEVMNDVELAWRAAFFPGEEGILVLAGTGSMAYGQGPEGRGRAGGFGPLFGDEGSAYWIGLEALRRASWAVDGRGPATRLTGIPQVLGVATLTEMLDLLQREPTTLRAKVAALAPLVDRWAGEGDGVAMAVLEAAAEELLRLARALATRLGTRRLSYAGGVFRGRVWELFTQRASLEGFSVQAPAFPPALGGAQLAWRVDFTR